MKKDVSLNWKGKMAFDANVDGHKITIDAKESSGGENAGPTPKPLILLSLGGCTAMDVISILKKMRVEPDDFNVIVDGDLTEEHPMRFTKMHIRYEFTGKNLPFEKLEKAVSLSQDRYCGISATLKESVEITHEIIINEQ